MHVSACVCVCVCVCVWYYLDVSNLYKTGCLYVYEYVI